MNQMLVAVVAVFDTETAAFAVFDTEAAAFEGLNALRDLHRHGDITLYASAVIV